MNEVNSLIEIQLAMKMVKKKCGGLISNLYMNRDKLNSWIDKKQIYKFELAETIFFFKEDTNFNNLYYFSGSNTTLDYSLLNIKSIVGDTLLVVNIVGNNSDIKSISDIFSRNGFYTYVTLNRMIRFNVESRCFKPTPDLKAASVSDSNAIFDLLVRHFDPISEQIPTIEEILNLIELNSVILLKENKEILGFAIYEIVGLTSNLRYWFVNPKYRNKQFGSKVLNEYLNKSIMTKRQQLWVLQSNQNAISRYLHYQFKSEDFYNCVMTSRNAQYETKFN